MELTVPSCHRYVRGTSILEVLVALALFAMAISGTLQIYALAVDATKQSFQSTTAALESGSRTETLLHYTARVEKNNQTGRGEAP